MAASFNGNFAKLVPRNHIAQTLFSRTVVYLDKNDTIFHLRFIDRRVTEQLQVSCEPVEESTDYDTSPDAESEHSLSYGAQYAGHFVLSFQKDRSPEMPHLGWRVGKGTSKSLVNRDVDLLLTRPGDIMSRSLASIHMLFTFNPRSGFLMLRAGSTKAPVEFQKGGTWEKLEYNEQRLLYLPATMLRAGLCEYELEYTIEEKHRESYFEQRDAFLRAVLPRRGGLPKSFRKLPGDRYVQRGKYIEFETQGSGAFGWISQGADTETGHPVAIKELRITTRWQRAEAVAEVGIGRRLHVSEPAHNPIYA